ncbi:MAG: HNH endonuclease [Candidatus Aenigmarchaeota archaeon]|nr:HNH endonuclease [Candidatus Aenigmarchaeota archaeon]
MQIQITKNNVSEFRESLSDRIHQRACEAASRHRQVEADLIEILQQVDRHRVYLVRGHSSLFLYVVKELRLSESVAYNLIAVARKAREVPELKTEIQSGAITLSNARKIAPVLNRENKAEWLAKASALSQRQLEKAVVQVRPQLATPERATYVTPSRVKLEVGLSEKDMLKLRRVQDLFCQSRKRPVTLEEVLVSLTDEYLARRDPLEKAKRQKVQKGLQRSAREMNTIKPDSQIGTQLEIEAESGIETKPEIKAKSEIKKESTEIASVCEKDSVKNPPVSVKPVALQACAARAVETDEEDRAHAESSTRSKGANGETRETYVRKPNYIRETVSAEILHQVNLRDQRRCTHTNPKGERCGQARWIEIHHKTPVSKGGMNRQENLTTLCSAHHKWLHSQG